MNDSKLLRLQLTIVLILVTLLSCEILILHPDWFGGVEADPLRDGTLSGDAI
jgi:hypothetical protein